MSLRHWVEFSSKSASGVAPIDPSTIFTGGFDGIWLDFSDLSTMWQNVAKSTAVAADGDLIRVITDKSGNAYDLTAPSDALRPTYKTGSSLHWALFASKVLYNGTLGALSSESAFTKIIGIEITFKTSNSCVDAFPGATVVTQFTVTGSTNHYSNPSVYGTAANGPIQSTTKYVISQVFDGSLSATHADRNKVYVNGNLLTWAGTTGTINATTTATATAAIGAANSAAAAGYNGKIFQYIAVNKALSDADRAGVEAYVMDKLGI